MNIDKEQFKPIFDQLADGIVVMDEKRIIHYINARANELTGWQLGSMVPYCMYCQYREIEQGDERCILASDHSLAAFRSHIPKYDGGDADFEMTLSQVNIEGKILQVLLLREPICDMKSEQGKLKKVLIQETMLAQEAERKRIARELHDHIGQNVYNVFLGIEGLKRCGQSGSCHINKMTDVIEETLTDIRKLCKDLRPQLLFDAGLKVHLKEAVKDWKKIYDVDFHLMIDLDPSMKHSSEKELHLFRFIQEAVNNGVRHGKAKSIFIRLHSKEDKIYFYIVDDGDGFEPGKASTKGLGLRHMYERINMIDGEVNWLSNKGGPTKVEGYVCLLEEVDFY